MLNLTNFEFIIKDRALSCKAKATQSSQQTDTYIQVNKTIKTVEKGPFYQILYVIDENIGINGPKYSANSRAEIRYRVYYIISSNKFKIGIYK